MSDESGTYTSGTDRYEVSVTLSAGGSVEAESIEEALEEAKGETWSSSTVTGITVRNPETGEELEWFS